MDNKSLNERISGLEREVKLLKLALSPDKISQHARKELSVKEYILLKKPTGDVQKTLAIACYLEQRKSMGSFNAKDLVSYFRLAKEPVPGNINDKVNLNIKKAHMMKAEDKKDGITAWSVTNRGEQFVNNGFKE